MANKDINRIKVILVEKKKTSKWIAGELGKDPATESKRCTNVSQPSLDTLVDCTFCSKVYCSKQITSQEIWKETTI